MTKKEGNSTKPPFMLPKPLYSGKAFTLPKAYVILSDCNLSNNEIVQSQVPSIKSEILKTEDQSEETTISEKDHLCCLCDAIFPSKISLLGHLKIHAYKCNACVMPFKDKQSLDEHRKSHVKAKRNKCEKSNISRPLFSCATCNYTSLNKKNLCAHVRKHVNSYLLCKFCGRSYKNMKKHVINSHNNNLLVSCDICGKAFSKKSSLSNHIKMHSRINSCQVCGRNFAKNGSLLSHMRTHSGVKPYPCLVCGKNFTRSNALKQHVLTHTGQRPYNCDICGKSFTQKSGLSGHRKTHLGPLPSLPPLYISGILKKFEEEFLETFSK